MQLQALPAVHPSTICVYKVTNNNRSLNNVHIAISALHEVTSFKNQSFHQFIVPPSNYDDCDSPDSVLLP